MGGNPDPGRMRPRIFQLLIPMLLAGSCIVTGHEEPLKSPGRFYGMFIC